MSEYKEAQLRAFRDELKKVAFTPPKWLGSLGAAGGIGVGAGGAVGAGYGAIKGYQEAKDQGASTGQSLGAALGRGVSTGMKGALVGGAVGAVGGGVAHALRPEQMEAWRKGVTDSSSFARFGQRQVHGLTGYTPEQGLGSLRHGAVNRRAALEAAKHDASEAAAGKDIRGWGDKLLQRTPEEAAKLRVGRAQHAYEAAQKAEAMGLTNVPGYVKSLVTNPVETVTTAAQDQLAGSSLPMKAMMLGLPAAQLAGAVRQDPNERNALGHTRGEAIGEAVTGIGTGLLMGPLPMVTQMAATAPLSMAGRRAGRLLDRSQVEAAPAAATTGGA